MSNLSSTRQSPSWPCSWQRDRRPRRFSRPRGSRTAADSRPTSRCKANSRTGFKPTATPAPAATATISTTTRVIQPQQVSIDTQGLPYSWQANLVPATPYDTSQPPGPKGLPQHIEINFGVADPNMQQSGDPIIYIIPADAYRQMWDQAGNPSISNTISKIYMWTIVIQSPPPISGLPALPPEKISGVRYLAVQIGRAKSDLESASSSGRIVSSGARVSGCQSRNSGDEALVHVPGLHERQQTPEFFLLPGHHCQTAKTGRDVGRRDDVRLPRWPGRGETADGVQDMDWNMIQPEASMGNPPMWAPVSSLSSVGQGCK